MSQEILVSKIAQRQNLSHKSVRNTLSLIDEGATVPFISRYRKEATGSLNEVQIGDLSKAYKDLKELIKRKEFVLETIEEQGKLTSDLRRKIENCWESTILEDIYLPYKKKRKTRAVLAKERGLEPLARAIWMMEVRDLDGTARQYFNKNVKTLEDAYLGARDILAEKINEDAKYRNEIRRLFQRGAMINSKVVTKKKTEAEKYKDYFDYREPAKKAPAHRLLAVLRAEKEGLLKVKLNIEESDAIYKLESAIIDTIGSYECEQHLRLAIADSYKRLLAPSIETEFRNIYKEKADADAIGVFAENLKQLLLASPLGSKAVMGIDPGFRSGCKVVCLDRNGKLVHNSAIYPHPPQKKSMEAKAEIQFLVDKYKIDAIAMGNGTAGRETDSIVKEIKFDKKIDVYLINENGASVYSASEIARKEFPNHDVTVRGAVSIGRRLMDPLSELVKIDPKSIGVGQYQHDVNQPKLRENLTTCVENCVNAVGINLNTATEHVLTYVSGLGPTLAQNIVSFRSENGSFDKIEMLKEVPRMGAKAYEQSAGFLRIRKGANPLDNTGVHPERYGLVKKMAKDIGTTIDKLIGNEPLVETIEVKRYVSEDIGLPTITDILKELKKPGLDIRGVAKAFEFTPGINTIMDVKAGMVVNGIINNVTKFGAFVDIGIKEAALIHVSQLSDTFVKDPMLVVKLNQKVSARVIDVDLGRKRISLSLKQN